MMVGVPIDGAVLRGLREAEMWSQAQLAAKARAFARSVDENSGMDGATISKLEREKRPPSSDTLRWLVGALRPSREDLVRLLRGAEPQPRLLQLTRETKEAATKRSDFNKLALGGLAALIPSGALERLADGGPVDGKLVAGHEALADVLAEQFLSAHKDVLLPFVDRHAGVLLGLLERPMGGLERRRLDVLATGAHVEAATLALKTRRRTDARRYLATARDVAKESGNGTLEAQALAASATAVLPWHTHRLGGDPSRAGRDLAGALDRARGADGRTRAWVHRWTAVVSAASGDERGFGFHMEAADRALDEAPVTEAAGFLSRFAAIEGRETGATEGLGLILLGRADGAAAALARALAAAAPEWTSWRAMLLVDTAAVHVLQDEPVEACDCLSAALDLAAVRGYWVAVDRVLGVRSRFSQPWAGEPCVRELDERMRLLTA